MGLKEPSEDKSESLSMGLCSLSGPQEQDFVD